MIVVAYYNRKWELECYLNVIRVRAEWGFVYVQRTVNVCFLMLGLFRCSSAFLCLLSVSKSSFLDYWVLFYFATLYFRCSRLLCLLQFFYKKNLQAFLFAKYLNMFSRSVILTMPFSMDSIVKLFGLSCEIVDRKYGWKTSFTRCKCYRHFLVNPQSTKNINNAANWLSTSRYSNRARGVKTLEGKDSQSFNFFSQQLAINVIRFLSNYISISTLFYRDDC